MESWKAIIIVMPIALVITLLYGIGMSIYQRRCKEWLWRYEEFMRIFGIKPWHLEEIKKKYGVKKFDELYKIVKERNIETRDELIRGCNIPDKSEGSESVRMKRILDVCCGGKMFYFDKSDPRVLFCDNREISTTLCDGRKFEIKPDIKADFTCLPFKDCSFRLVVFDPPHLLYNSGKSKYKEMYGSLREIGTPTGWQQIKYGALYTDWRDMLKKGFAECFRVLEQGGVLIFKWNDTDVKVSEILKLTPEKPVFGHKSGKQNKTHWLCFFKESTKEKDTLTS